MTNEELQRVMEFIIKRQETFAEGMVQAESRLTRLETAVVNLYNAMSDIGKSQKALAETVTHLAESQRQLAESQAHTDQRVNVLIDILEQRRNGKDQE